MLQIIAPKEFKTIPWKNGLGETTELAISDGGSLNRFDWRLSIASVINNGVFSDFSGYQRNLVLIAGNGLTLEHNNNHKDNLTNLLDLANFNGACKTYGTLTEGPIQDFNIITNKQVILPKVNCYIEAQQISVILDKSNKYFAYSLSADILVKGNEHGDNVVPQGSLLKLSLPNESHDKDHHTFKVIGENMILIELQLNEAENI